MLKYKDLYEGFINILDNKDEYTENIQIICQKWTNVFENFYLNQKLPISGKLNPNLYPSLRIFKNGLLSAINNQNWNIQFEILVKNLHFNICQGVDMTGNFKTIPPTFPLKLQHCWKPTLSTKNIARILALNIFNWVQFTISVQISSGTTIKWI